MENIKSSDRCVMCGAYLPEGEAVCKACRDKVEHTERGKKPFEEPKLEKRELYVKGKGNVLVDVVTGNPYYDYLIHEVMAVCNCKWDKAAAVVAYVNTLGGEPVEFIHRLPQLVNKPVPDVDELLENLEGIRATEGRPRAFICFPEGYQNRAARRKENKAAGKKQRKGR